MRKKIKKAIPVRDHDGLSQLRPNAGGIDIGASEVWVDVGNKDSTINKNATIKALEMP